MHHVSMGKRGRKKRRPPVAKILKPPPFDVLEVSDERSTHAEAGFSQACARIRSLLVRFTAEDVALALNVSDLWPANISAQVKHQLAFAVYLSIPFNDFAPEPLESYSGFEEFSRTLIEALPNFPSLEDYWPESDWGEVLFTDGINARPSFYGGCVQRIPDFIEAFRILYGDSSEAMGDMSGARRMQAAILESVLRPVETAPEDAGTGHIEVAAKGFWEALRVALPMHAAPALTAGLIATPGTPTKWRTAQEFGDAGMSGEVVPWLGVQLEQVFVPLSLRNAPAVVLDFWSSRVKVASAQAAVRFSEFMSRRIKARSFIQGPLHVINRRARAARAVAAVLPGEETHYLVVFCDADELHHIDKSIAEMKHLMREEADWGFVRPATSEGIQLRNQDGRAPAAGSMDVIIVVGYVTTKLVRLRVPKAKDLRIVSIVDAITLFDAMKDIDELTRFWKYEAGLRKMVGGMPDLADLFGSFRDSHGQIIAGAVVPSLIMLDAHWGANWRYTQLREHWAGAPQNFPDERSAWDTNESRGGSSLRRVTARNAPRLAWSGRLGDCTVHFVLDVDLVDLQPDDGRVLETFIHCAADCLAEREALALSMVTLPYRRVVVECIARADALVTLPEEEAKLVEAGELLLHWQVIDDHAPREMHARLTVNLARVLARLQQVQDASFEVECATALMDVLSAHVRGRQLDAEEREAFARTVDRRPRFVMRSFQRTVDVPNFGEPDKPTPELYKVARRKLAELLMAQDVAPGRYELGEAKRLINAARAAYRNLVHQRLGSFDSESLIRYCVKQVDAASAEYDQQVLRHRQSLAHDVEYDREQSQAEAHEQFTRYSRNFRYAIEAALFLTQPQPTPARAADVLEVVAMIDWLLVLYGASDVLHNEIEVGGLNVDDQYVPEVFFSEMRDAQQDKFAREMAALRLGMGVADEDKLDKPFADDDFLHKLDAAFLADLGFTYRDLLKVLSTLIHWVSVDGGTELAFSYEASANDIATAAVGAHEDLHESAALRAIDFLVLKGRGIRRLAGRDEDTEDVPVWEHTKRVERFTIKPLILLPGGRLLWGASMADRTQRIWIGSISAGYLPADFAWTTVRTVVGKAKKALEDGLEDAAYAVCARVTPYAVKGLDFADRFPKQGFADVGDFDLLAYWPEGNRWLTGECKYNQPAFCVKDTRRLRDRVFGGGSEPGQFVKIERRRKFFAEHIDLIRQLLGWPEPTTTAPKVTEIYICKDLHWWLRFPPYEVPTKFSQIDTFGAWLAASGFVCARSSAPDSPENA